MREPLEQPMSGLAVLCTVTKMSGIINNAPKCSRESKVATAALRETPSPCQKVSCFLFARTRRMICLRYLR